MPDLHFKKRIEDFTCEHCGWNVKGNGYTNHCTNCLYSKHVDISPGDRAEICGGIMPPINFEVVKKNYILIHKCEKCGTIKKNVFAKDDNVNALVDLSQSIAKKLLI